MKLSLTRRAAPLAAIFLATTALAQEGSLVTPEGREANLQNPDVRLIEVSVNPGVYERGRVCAGAADTAPPLWSFMAATGHRAWP